MSLADSIEKTIDSKVKKAMRAKEQTVLAEYAGEDSQGKGWVVFSGASIKTPLSRAVVEAAKGDIVSVTVGDGSAVMDANISNPSAGLKGVKKAESKAEAARTEAKAAAMKAATAQGSADEAAEIAEFSKAYVKEMEAANITAESLTADHASIGHLEAETADIGTIRADSAKVHDLTADQLTAATGYIGDLAAGNVTAQNIIADHGTVENLESNFAHITNGVIDNATIGYADVNDLNAHYAEIDLANIANGTIKSAMIDDAQITSAKILDGTIQNADIANGTIENAKIKDATIETAKIKDAAITTAKINDAAITTAKIGDAAITNAKIGSAAIGTANIQQAAITNALIANEAVGNAQIIGVSANKLTAGTIDASNINVHNLRADSLVVTKLNGQPVFGGYEAVNSNASGYSQMNPQQQGWYEISNGQMVLSTDTSVNANKAYYSTSASVSLYDQNYIDSMESRLDQRIDGAIQTYNGTVVPTLINWPYTDWYDTTTVPVTDNRQEHIGDLYYVVNESSQQDGYCYRFAYDNTSHDYMWVLIKDSDVTAALGRIDDLETFESETTVWINETDEGLETIRTNHTTLSGRVDGTVVESKQCWFTKANSTPPSAPSNPNSPITNNSPTGNSSYNQWNLAVPVYNATYPYYFYCWQYKFSNNTYGWSAVIYDQATTESEERARTGVTNAAAAQGTANSNIKSSEQLWYTSNSETPPGKPYDDGSSAGTGVPVSSTATGKNQWTKVVPVYDSTAQKYHYCYQQQRGDGKWQCTAPVYDKATSEAMAKAQAALPASTFETFQQTTFKDVVDTVDEQSSTITTLTETTQKIPIGEGSGEHGFQVNDSAGLPLIEVRGHGWAEQVATTGKNLLPLVFSTIKTNNTGGTWNGSAYTVNGITFTVNADGSVHVSGTASANAVLTLMDNAAAVATLTNGTQYTISGTNGDVVVQYWSSTTGVNTGTFTYDSSASNRNAAIGIASGKSAPVGGVTIYPQLEAGSTATSWEPYSGGAASPRPDWPQPIRVAKGRNLIQAKFANLLVQNDGSISSNTGTNVYAAEVEQNQVYAVSAKNKNRLRVASVPSLDITSGMAGTSIIISNDSAVTFNSGSAKYVAVYVSSSGDESEPQLELGSTPSPYVPYGCVGLDVHAMYIRTVEHYITKTDGSYGYDSDPTTAFIYMVSPGTEYTIAKSGGNRLRIGEYDEEPNTSSLSGTLVFGNNAATEAVIKPSKKYIVVYVTSNNVTAPVSWVRALSFTIPIPLPLKSDGTRWAGAAGDYADSLVVDSAGGYAWTCELEEQHYDGSNDENWQIENASDVGKSFYLIISGAKGSEILARNILFTHSKCITGHAGAPASGEVYIVAKFLNVALGQQLSITDLNGWRTWLSTHNVTVLYPLATPTTESGYITLPMLPHGCTVSCPELENISGKWWTIDGANLGGTFEASTNTVNSVRQTADSNQAHISNITTRVGLNPDGTGTTTDIVSKYSQLDQDLDGLTSRVGKVESQTSLRGILKRENWPESTWANFPVGSSDAWYNTNYSSTGATSSTGIDASTLRVGDLIQITGKSTDTGVPHNLVGKVTALTGDSPSAQIPLIIVAVDDMSSMASRLSSAESSITQNADAIALRVTQTEMTQAIDAIELGGRNYLSKYSSPARWDPASNIGASGYHCQTSSNNTVVLDAGSGDTWFSLWMYDDPLVDGETYTFSFDVSGLLEGTWYTWGIVRQANGAFLNFKMDHNGKNYCTFEFDTVKFNVDAGYATAEMPNGVIARRLEIDDYVQHFAEGQGNITLTNFKIEKGNKPTDWTPPPEEMDARVSSAETIIQQTANNVLIKATKSGASSSDVSAGATAVISSLINVAPEGVQIDAAKVNITGTAIFSALGSTNKVVTSSVTQWYSSTSASSLSGGTWAASQPSVSAGRYIWTRQYVTYSDGTTVYLPSENGVCSQGQTDLSSYSTTSDMNTAIQNASNGYTILWNVDNTFTNINNGEGYICAFDPQTGTKSNDNGYVMWNGVRRTVTKQEINPNTVCPYNIPIYVVFRLYSSTDTTGVNYLVWYDSEWKYSSLSPSSVAGTWNWIADRDIVLGSFVESGSEQPFTDCIVYNPPRSSKEMTIDTVTARSANAAAAAAQGTANSAAPKTDAVKRTQRIYYRKNSTGAPSTPGTASSNWVTAGNDGSNLYDQWTTKIPPMKDSGNDRYLYLYTCEQKEVVSATNPVSYTSVLLDASTTVIDGGTIVTGSVTANKLNADSINASNSLTVGAISTDSQNQILNSNIKVGGTNLLVNSGDLTKWGKEGGIVATWDSTANMYKVTDTAHSSSRWGIYQDISGIEPNTEYTISIDCMAGTVAACFGAQNGTTNWPATRVSTDTATKTRLSWIWTTASDTTTARVYLHIYPTAVGDYAYFSKPKLEKGNKATDWCRSESDIDNELADSAKTATDYIYADSSGITIASANPSSQNQRMRLTSSSMALFSSDNLRRFYADSSTGVVIGDPADGNVVINTQGFHAYDVNNKRRASVTSAGLALYDEDGLTNIGEFKATQARIGKSGNTNPHFEMSATELSAYDTSGKYFSVTRDGLTYGSHTAMDAADNPNVNLFKNAADLSKWSHEVNCSAEWDATVGMYKMSTGSNASSRWGIYQDVAVAQNTTYTFSVLMRKGSCAAFAYVGVQDGTSWSGSFPSTNGLSENANSGLRRVVRFTTGANSHIARVYLVISPTAANDYAYYYQPRLIIGVDESARTATNYITDINDSGITIHPSSGGDSPSTNYLKLNANGVYAYKDSTHFSQVASDGFHVYSGDASNDIAHLGSSLRIGKAAGPRTVIQNSGTDFYGYDSTSGAVLMAHIGYASGNAQNGTAIAPYYSFCQRHPTGAIGNYSFAEGVSVTASGFASHAEGDWTTASSYWTHAEGYTTVASAQGAHAEGDRSTASGQYSHAEGTTTQATNYYAHAEGITSTASGEGSHAEGCESVSSGTHSHAEGRSTQAIGHASHAGGMGTIAGSASQMVIGEYNVADTSSSETTRGTYAFIIGNGDTSTRSNALTVDWSGNVVAAGSLTTSGDDSSWQTLANTNNTIKYRKHHGVVYIAGVSNNGLSIGSGNGTSAGTLPTGYRPGTDISGSLTTTGANTGQYTIGTGGGITLWNFGGTSGYWRFNTSYPV